MIKKFVRKRFFGLCALACSIALTSMSAESQAQLGFSYAFPGVTPDVNIAIGNINTQSVSVTVAFYRTTGDVTSTTFLLEPGRQSRLTSTSAGVSDFTGSVVITSGLPLTVSASLFTADTAFDNVVPSESASALVIPFAPLDNALIDLSIFNSGTEQAEARVVPIKQDGTQQGVTSVTLDPKHTATLHLSATEGVSHILIRTAGFFRGDRPVAASAFIYNYQPSASGAVPRTDFAFIEAIPESRATTATILPYFAQGEDYFSIVEVVNLAGSEQTVTLTARHRNGSIVSGSKNPAIIEDIPAFGATRQTFAEMFGLSVTELTQGTITVEGTALLQAAVAIGNVSKPSLAVIPSGDRQLTSFAYQLRRTGREFFTGVSLLNTGDRDANVALWFLADDGKTVSSVGLVVPRAQQIADDLAKLFPEAQGNGFILVRSDVPLLATGVDGRANNSALATRRPLFASADFNPPPLERFLAAGTARDQGVGVPNVAIRLSGPVETTTLTDAAGVFVFRDIPTGSYRLIPIPIGYTITPLERTFTIWDANSQKNDFDIGLIAPSIDRVTPEGVVVNADTTTVVIQGRNFISGSVAVFEVTEVPTTVVNNTQLIAELNRSLLTSSGDVALLVRNRGPSTSFIDSEPVAFTVGNTPPTLASITGQPSPLIVGSVRSPFTITVTGAGFTPATRVRVDRIGRATTFVSEKELRATILPGDVAAAGLVPITVQNPGAVPSAPFQLVVLYPVPRIAAISPNVLTAQVALDAQAVQVTVDGSGFVQDPNDASITAVVIVDGRPVSTQFVSSTRLIGIVPASLLASAGVKQIAVGNPSPTLASSDALPLFISNPAPVVTSVQAGPLSFNPVAQTGETVWVQVLINGANFSSDSVAWVSPPCDMAGFRRAQTTTRISSSQLAATIPIRCAGTYQLQVRTPQPGGGVSPTVLLNVPAMGAN